MLNRSDAGRPESALSRYSAIGPIGDCANRVTQHFFICDTSQAPLRTLPCLLQGLHSPLNVFLIEHAFGDATFREFA